MSEKTGEEAVRRLVRAALGPVGSAEPERDLWPEMLRRLEEPPARVSWLDWALAGAVLAWFFVFPEGIPAVLYHL